MRLTTVRCDVLGANVTRIADLEGAVTRIICSEYQESTGACRLLTRAHNGGPLAQLLDRVAEGALDHRTTQCHLGMRSRA